MAFTGVVPAPALGAHDPSESDAAYVHRLQVAPLFPYLAVARATAAGAQSAAASMEVGVIVPVVPLLSSAPTLSSDGSTSTYTIPLDNLGQATAGPFAFEDAVNGVTVPATVVAPAALSSGATDTATVSIATPIGPHTNTLTMTWQDRNGNVYGPLTYSE